MREPRTPTLVASRWRKAICDELMTVTGYIATGGQLAGAPTIRDEDSMVTDPYAFVLAIVGADGLIIQSHGIRLRDDLDRVLRSIKDAFYPDEAERRLIWQEQREAEAAAYILAHPFACQRGGYCDRRFATERGRDGHYRHAARQAAGGTAGEGRDYMHRGEPRPTASPRPRRLSLVADA